MNAYDVQEKSREIQILMGYPTVFDSYPSIGHPFLGTLSLGSCILLNTVLGMGGA